MQQNNSRFALIDCNNFYVSCERAFNPKLNHRPVVVLSNNDGCIISRSNEIKRLGVPMGAPVFKWQRLLDMHHTVTFSSNFALYGDISNRIMSLINRECSDMEVYSIDEAFVTINPRYTDPIKYATKLRNKIYQWTGIPVSIGIGKTKTLAKVANHLSKRGTGKDNVCLIDSENDKALLQKVKVHDIWGIGRRKQKFLKINGIYNAYDLKQANSEWIQRHMTIISRHTVDELNGRKKIELEGEFATKKSISTSRSFSRMISDLNTLKNAISSHASRSAEKLRLQNSYVNSIGVYLCTNRFRTDMPQYRRYINVQLPVALNDTSGIINAALEGLYAIYKSGYEYKKCGVILNDLVQANEVQQSLFYDRREKDERISASIDQINQAFGSDTIRYAVQGENESWSIKREKLSSSYTTNWNEFLTLKV